MPKPKKQQRAAAVALDADELSSGEEGAAEGFLAPRPQRGAKRSSKAEPHRLEMAPVSEAVEADGVGVAPHIARTPTPGAGGADGGDSDSGGDGGGSLAPASNGGAAARAARAREKKLAGKAMARKKKGTRRDYSFGDEPDGVPEPPAGEDGGEAVDDWEALDDESDGGGDGGHRAAKAATKKEKPQQKPAEDTDPQPQAQQPKGKGKKGKKGRQDVDDMYIAAEEEAPEEKPAEPAEPAKPEQKKPAAQPQAQQPQTQQPKGKGKKGKKGRQDVDGMYIAAEEEAPEEKPAEPAEPEQKKPAAQPQAQQPQTQQPKGKGKKGKKGRQDVDGMYIAAEEEAPEEKPAEPAEPAKPAEPEQKKSAPQPQAQQPKGKGKKGKKGRQDVDGMYIAAEEEAPEEKPAEPAEPEQKKPAAQPQAQQPQAQQPKGKGKKGKKGRQDVDGMYIAADEEAPEEKPAEPAEPAESEQKKPAAQPQAQAQQKKPQPKKTVAKAPASAPAPAPVPAPVPEPVPATEPHTAQETNAALVPAAESLPSDIPASATQEEKPKSETPTTEEAPAAEAPKAADTAASDAAKARTGKAKETRMRGAAAAKKAMMEAIQRQKEEEERRIREAQEAQKRAEEAAKREAEEAARQRKEEERLASIRAQKRAEDKKRRKQMELEAQRRLALAKLGVSEEEITRRIQEQNKAAAQKPASAAAAAVGKGKPKPKSKPKQQKAQAATPTPTTATQPPKEEEVTESWEDEDEVEQKPVEPAAPSPAPATTATASAPAPEASKEKPKEESKPSEAAKPKEKEEPKKPETAEESKEKEKHKGKVLRSPICSVLGHVDVGKTSLLDKIRRTNVQAGEAGGITQQIGASYFPIESIQKVCSGLGERLKRLEYRVPGLLIIDTPGHESFSNLRSRGSSLCDIAILVVDLMHGIEPQTIESINMLRAGKTPFIVALNKVDRLYAWKANPWAPFLSTLNSQAQDVKVEFEQRVTGIIGEFAGQSLNAMLYYKAKDIRDYRTTVSLVPTSASTGEGIPDLLMLVIQLTQRLMEHQLYFDPHDLQASVLEVKTEEGLGTCIDVILVNGILRETDTIVVCGINGPIVTPIRALLTPEPMREIRVRCPYVHNKMIQAAQGVRIAAQGLEEAVAGSSLRVLREDDDVEDIKEEVQKDLKQLQAKLDTSGVGVSVQASTLGSLEALLTFLHASKIPVSAIRIGPVHKKDVMRCSVMLDKPATARYGVILCFAVKVDRDAADLAEDLGVQIMTADIIYHLFDQFTAYLKQIEDRERAEAERAGEAIWPVVMNILPQFVFNTRDPIIVGCRIKDGVLRIGTPIVVVLPNKDDPKKLDFLDIGRVASIEVNKKTIDVAKKGDEVAVKIVQVLGGQQYLYGRQFDHRHELVSRVTRESLDCLKRQFKDQLTKEDIALLFRLKSLFGIGGGGGGGGAPKPKKKDEEQQ